MQEQGHATPSARRCWRTASRTFREARSAPTTCPPETGAPSAPAPSRDRRIRPARPRLAWPWPRAGRNMDRCAAPPSRRRGRRWRWRRSNGSARTPILAVELRKASTLSTHEPCRERTRAKPSVREQMGLGVERVDFQERLGAMPAKLRAFAGAGHAVPLVAQAAGVEPQRKFRADWLAQRRRLRRDEARLAVGRRKSAGGKQPRRAAGFAGAHRPLHRLERVVILIGNCREPAEIEHARAVVLEGGERGMLAEHIGGASVGERVAEAQVTRGLADDPPIRPGVARQRQEGALARDAPVRIGDGAVLLAPGRGRQQHMRRRLPRCRSTARSRTRPTGRAFSAHRASRRRAAATPPDWSPSPTAP